VYLRARSVPRGYSLCLNYPNPLNSAAITRYDLPVDVKVDVRICDIAGREAAVLAEGFRAGSFTDVKKLIVAKFLIAAIENESRPVVA
jgi:hypothetical protein